MNIYWFGEWLIDHIGTSMRIGDYFRVKIPKNAYLTTVELAKVPKDT